MRSFVVPGLAFLLAIAATHTAAGLASRHQARGTLASTKPIILECKFPSRAIQSVVLMPAERKVRMWFLDGGGSEWTSVNTSLDPVETRVENDRALVLSEGLRHVTFYDLPYEKSEGSCWRSSRTDWPREHTAAVLKQPWEWDR
jgi:hypothetical protein